ncbi:MAG: 2-isopropylmalate synthase [Alphaproteobacteria bacterium CG_4_10_14_0_2_um_filter_63_37]|nr:MAG: 2-isopropylmalate synthase [Proteobacteria bacterium CG1_02_64_396]PJA24262.1 MAG: 2-isopropylmalate synthase [Alphaproteobacteria bacterium CG_4_10_14_0_2_um_filter_63_37]
MSDHLIVFDTTLRDGEQSPGASMNTEEKLRIARQLERLRVDVIEAGFPVASPGDFDAVHRIAQTVKESTVCGLARAREADIDAAGRAIAPAAQGRIHTFIATSPIHMEKKLRMSPDEVVAAAIKAIGHARQYTDDVEFSAEDAGRTEMDFLCRVVEAAIKAGAKTINIPDTVGYTLPWIFGERIATLMNRVPNIDQAIISVHCHNDLGLAVANSLAAVQAGARQVECTINGIGERAGNAAMEEVVMALKVRRDCFGGIDTNIDATQITPASRLLSAITGINVQPNKAIIGANAFAHESGIHQDGMLKAQETYEIMTPESVGQTKTELVLGKHSGRHAFADRLASLGVNLEGDELNRAFLRFKDLADVKKQVFDEDLLAIVDEEITRSPDRFVLKALSCQSGTGTRPSAKVVLTVDGEEKEQIGEGDGPVDAAFKAIRTLVPVEGELLLYQVNAITSGTDAMGEVTVRLRQGGRVVNGQGADTDIIVASARAYVNALNKLAGRVRTEHPQL